MCFHGECHDIVRHGGAVTREPTRERPRVQFPVATLPSSSIFQE